MATRVSGGPSGAMRGAVNTGQAFARLVIADGRIKFPTGGSGRAMEGVNGAAVKDIGSADGIVNSVGDLARQRLHQMSVMHVGGMINAQALGIADPGKYFADGLQALFDHANTLGLSQLEVMQLVCGKDTFGRANKLIPREERVRRILEAQLAGVSELQVHVPGYNYAAMYDAALLPAMLEFTYMFISRAGYEHGIRFELRQTHVLHSLPYLSGLKPIYQFRSPQVLGNALAASSDALLPGLNFTVSTQLKALSTLDAIAGGGVRFTTSGGVITGVTGPNVLAQVVSDGLRARRRGFRVPDSQAALWTGVGAPPASTAHWHDLSTETLVIVDSSYLMNQVIELAGKAFAENPTLRFIDPMVHINVPLYRRAMIRDILGSSIERGGDELAQRGAVEAYLAARLPVLENYGNIELAKPHIVSAVGRPLSMRLIASHQTLLLGEFLENNGVVPVGAVDWIEL
jgi:hypothetical protein